MGAVPDHTKRMFLDWNLIERKHNEPSTCRSYHDGWPIIVPHLLSPKSTTRVNVIGSPRHFSWRVSIIVSSSVSLGTPPIENHSNKFPHTSYWLGIATPRFREISWTSRLLHVYTHCQWHVVSFVSGLEWFRFILGKHHQNKTYTRHDGRKLSTVRGSKNDVSVQYAVSAAWKDSHE